MTVAPTSIASAPEDLAVLRAEIDAIDHALHEALIARGEIIDRLIAVKARLGGGSAFRPDREASMMRRLLGRHRGILPLDTVEGIWRIIISTFTYVQAPYAVHADTGHGDAEMRDSCRFHFGFTVPLVTHECATDVIQAVASARNDLGLVRAVGATTPWWTMLEAPDAPKVIARLPFVERADHAAGLPLFLIARPLSDAAPQETRLYALTLRGSADLPTSPQLEILAQAAGRDGRFLLVAASGGMSHNDLVEAFAVAGPSEVAISDVGSHAARYELDAGCAAAQ